MELSSPLGGPAESRAVRTKMFQVWVECLESVELSSLLGCRVSKVSSLFVSGVPNVWNCRHPWGVQRSHAPFGPTCFPFGPLSRKCKTVVIFGGAEFRGCGTVVTRRARRLDSVELSSPLGGPAKSRAVRTKMFPCWAPVSKGWNGRHFWGCRVSKVWNCRPLSCAGSRKSSTVVTLGRVQRSHAPFGPTCFPCGSRVSKV